MKPTRAEVKIAVTTIIAEITGLKPQKIKEEHVLKEHPLYMDDMQLIRLALELRKYIKSFDKTKTILVATIRKSGLTVGKLIDLVYNLLK